MGLTIQRHFQPEAAISGFAGGGGEQCRHRLGINRDRNTEDHYFAELTLGGLTANYTGSSVSV